VEAMAGQTRGAIRVVLDLFGYFFIKKKVTTKQYIAKIIFQTISVT
jgi:hypothetical protein